MLHEGRCLLRQFQSMSGINYHVFGLIDQCHLVNVNFSTLFLGHADLIYETGRMEALGEGGGETQTVYTILISVRGDSSMI